MTADTTLRAALGDPPVDSIWTLARHEPPQNARIANELDQSPRTISHLRLRKMNQLHTQAPFSSLIVDTRTKKIKDWVTPLSYPVSKMTDHTTILVPIRYPLTDGSARTLAAAGRLAHEHSPADLIVLHVNLYQTGDKTQTRELTEAISATLDGVEASVTTRRGFLVEEVILEEVSQNDADIVVVGANQQAGWRRLVGRVLRNDPAVSSYLREHTTDLTEVREVDTAGKAPVAESA